MPALLCGQDARAPACSTWRWEGISIDFSSLLGYNRAIGSYTEQTCDMNFPTIITYAFVDSFDILVLLLLLSAAASRLPAIGNTIQPFLITATIVIGLCRFLPLWAVIYNDSFSLFACMATFIAAIGSLYSQLPFQKRILRLDFAIDVVFLTGSLCLAVMLLVTITFPIHSMIGPLAWVTFLTYSTYRIAPWRCLPFHNTSEMGKFFLFLAIGLYLVRTAFWGYTAANAVITENAGSFRMKGIVFAQHYAQAWQFNQLDQWIQNQIHLTNRQSPTLNLPIEAESYALLESGLKEAEVYRRRLITPNQSGITGANLIAQAILRFQELAQEPLSNRPGLQGFQLDGKEITQQIEGNGAPIDADQVLGNCAGKWHGMWESDQVDHTRADVIEAAPPRKIGGLHQLFLHSFQSAWFAEDFGWSCLVSTEYENDANILLGIVYHLFDSDPNIKHIRRPFIGIDAGNGRTIRLMTGEVWFEEIQPANNGNEEKYTITGFRYIIHDGIIETVDSAFQAVFTRWEDRRPPFFRFQVDFSIP
ncbi:MAG: hypothetical protein C4527_17135 [Candidatus Omnitrophota bacterium]|nr:MAG: hypothetical protein C4527_17135 [Candidatus Omnitrophota bacterium]